MREIKYRGLSNSSKVWVYGSSDLAHSNFNTTSLSTFWRWVEDYAIEVETVTEFTGLHDLKGVEIYEGDVVKHPLCVAEPHDEKEPCETFVGRIQFEVDKGQYFAVNMKRNGYVIPLTEAYKFEVIGNIYENPEMVKEER